MRFTCPQEFIDLAHMLADAARPIALHYFRSENLGLDFKLADAPVTKADSEIETEMRRLLALHRPQDGIYGEEQGHTNPDAEWTWLLDPIDGTHHFSVGYTHFGVLIALHHKTHGFIFGMCDQPVSKDRWVGVAHHGTTLNGKAVTSRGTKKLDEAIFGCTDPLRLPPDALALVQKIRAQAVMKVYGGNCLEYAQLASGFVDVIVEGNQQIYDIAPFVPMIESSGGKVTYLNGDAIAFGRNDIIVCAATPELHAQVLKLYQEIAP